MVCVFFVGLSADLERPVCIGSCAAFQDVRGWLGYRVGDVSLYVGGGVYQSIDYSIVSPLTSSPSRAILGTGFNWSFSSKNQFHLNTNEPNASGAHIFVAVLPRLRLRSRIALWSGIILRLAFMLSQMTKRTGLGLFAENCSSSRSREMSGIGANRWNWASELVLVLFDFQFGFRS